MRHMMALLAVGVFLVVNTGPAGGQGPYELVDYAAKWRHYDNATKVMMVECFHTGIAIFVEQAHSRDSASLEHNAEATRDYGTFDYADIAAGVDAVYAEGANKNIPIPHAVNIAILKHNRRPTGAAWRMATRTKTYHKVQ